MAEPSPQWYDGPHKATDCSWYFDRQARALKISYDLRDPCECQAAIEFVASRHRFPAEVAVELVDDLVNARNVKEMTV